MKYLHPSGNNHVYESSLKSSINDEYTASKQMKRNQTSERKNGIQTLNFHLFFLCLIMTLSACDKSTSYNFNSSSDALESYKDFHASMKVLSKVDAKTLSDYINKWQELQDTVFGYIKKDPHYTAHVSLPLDFDSITDSIRNEFIRLSRDYTMKDVALVKLNTSLYSDEQELMPIKDKALEFFSSLDKNKPFENNDISKLLLDYQDFLVTSEHKGISNMENVNSFIAEEDRHFRSFLLNIDKYSEMGLGKITLITERICGNIYKEAYNDKIPQEEVLVYMSMRNARRLLMNAEVCYKQLKMGKVKNPQQANAFLWMIIQPYLSIDSFTIAMLTDEQKTLMTSIAEAYNNMVAELHAKQLVDDKVSLRLPEQIMQLYIITL